MKKIEATKNLEYYMGLAYTLVLKKDDDGDVVGKVEELDGCVAHGSNETEALSNLKVVLAAWIEATLESGNVVPEPGAAEEMPSGKWLQRVPRSLHGNLTKLAKREGVSLNHLVTTILTDAAAAKQLLGGHHIPSSLHKEHQHLHAGSPWGGWIGLTSSHWQLTHMQEAGEGGLVSAVDLVMPMIKKHNTKELFYDAREKKTSKPAASLSSEGEYESFVQGLQLFGLGLASSFATLDREAYYDIEAKDLVKIFTDGYDLTGLGKKHFDVRGHFTVRLSGQDREKPALVIECDFEAHLHAAETINKTHAERFTKSELRLILLPYARQFFSTVTSQMSIAPVIIPLAKRISAKRPSQ